MTKKPGESFEYLSNNPDYVPNPEIEEFMEEEILRAPKDPERLANRLRNNTAASPKDAGGDLDCSGRCKESGSETLPATILRRSIIGGRNAQAIVVSTKTTKTLGIHRQIERRDRERFELDPRSKTTDDMI